MHQLRGTDNGIHRTGLNAKGATDTKLFVNHSNLQRLRFATTVVEGDERLIEQLRQGGNACLTTRGAAVNCSPL
jgi:hypothetical protein